MKKISNLFGHTFFGKRACLFYRVWSDHFQNIEGSAAGTDFFAETDSKTGDFRESPGEHYVVKIEQDMLFIYEMPENIIYDSMRAETLHFPAGEIPALREGIVFQTLPEVYELLENSMS